MLMLRADQQRVHEDRVVGGRQVGAGGRLVAQVEHEDARVALLELLSFWKVSMIFERAIGVPASARSPR